MRPLLLLFGGTFGSAIFSMAAQLLLARALSVADYGRLATVLAAVNLLSPIAAFGINWFWVQAFGREGYGGFRWVQPSFRLLAATNAISVLALVGYIMLAAGMPQGTAGLVAFLSSMMLLGQSAVEIASTRFQLEERFGLLALWQAISQLGRLIVVGVLLVASIRGLSAVLSGYGLIGLGLFLGGLFLVRQFRAQGLELAGHVRPPLRQNLDHPTVLATAKLSFPFAFITIFYLVYFQSAVLLLAHFLGPESTAIFSAALLILSAIYLVPNIIFTKFLLGRICRWAEHDKESFRAILHVSVVGMMGLGIVAAVVTAVGAPFAVPLIFGHKYAATIRVLVWLTPTIPLRFVQSAYSGVLVSEENVRRRVKYAGISAACSLAINLALLPTLGLPGAVLASIVSEAVLLVLSAWGAGRHLEGVRLIDSFRAAQVMAAMTRVLRVEAGRGGL